MGIPQKFRVLLDAVKFEHSVFALPFAYLGMVLAAGGIPTGHQFTWITVAMVAARTTALSSNRLIDRHLDALNPRTAERALPKGLLRPRELLLMALGSLAVFFVAAFMLNTLALLLAPVAAAIVIGYSYTKRFTWTSHFVLGLSDAIAPAGGWIAVQGNLSWEACVLAIAVGTWIAGFDILYSCQDIEFDRKQGLHSIPQRWGIPTALRWARVMHLLTAMLLLGVGLALDLSWPYYVGWGVASALLIYEHRIVAPNDLSRLNMAFFNVNGYIAVAIFVATLASLYI